MRGVKKKRLVLHARFSERQFSRALVVIGSCFWRHVCTSRFGCAHSSPRNAHNPFLMWANHLFREIGLDMRFSWCGWGRRLFSLTDCEERDPHATYLHPFIHPPNRSLWQRVDWLIVIVVRSKSVTYWTNVSFIYSQNAGIYMLIGTKCQTNGKLDQKDVHFFPPRVNPLCSAKKKEQFFYLAVVQKVNQRRCCTM